MNDPFRLKVLKRLTETLEEINPDHPNAPFQHEFDLRGKVYRGRNRFDWHDGLPMISILEPPIPLETLVGRNTNVYQAGPWELLIQGFVEDDLQNPSDPAHRLMAEVKAKLVAEKRRDRGNNIFGMGNRVHELMLGQGSVRPPDEASDKAFFWLTLTLQLAENIEDPYT